MLQGLGPLGSPSLCIGLHSEAVVKSQVDREALPTGAEHDDLMTSHPRPQSAQGMRLGDGPPLSMGEQLRWWTQPQAGEPQRQASVEQRLLKFHLWLSKMVS